MRLFALSRANHGIDQEAESLQRDTHLSRGERIQETAPAGTLIFSYCVCLEYPCMLDSVWGALKVFVVDGRGLRMGEVEWEEERGAFATFEVSSMDGHECIQALLLR